MKLESRNKYLFSKEDIPHMKVILKRILITVFIILVIKSLRVFSKTNEAANSFLTSILYDSSLETLVEFFAVNLIVFGSGGLLVAYILIGKRVLKNKFFYTIFYICMLDAVFLLIFPEIPASIAKAIFLN